MYINTIAHRNLEFVNFFVTVLIVQIDCMYKLNYTEQQKKRRDFKSST